MVDMNRVAANERLILLPRDSLKGAAAGHLHERCQNRLFQQYN